MLVVSFLSLFFFAFANAGTLINTDLGLVQGKTHKGVDIWNGIPFAAPPIGDLRFRSPQPPTPWEGVRPAKKQGHICPQLHITDFLYLGNEDCLYLDIYAPSKRVDSLPVLVWMFGGGYVFGDGYEFGFYDGQHLALQRDMIVVTINYRVGPLGFLALDELTNEDPDGLSGNQALLDQRAALQWVQKNILNFGGDPNRVTIAGESAGAFSVCWHLAAPASAGLFQAAILESTTCDGEEFFLTENDSKSWSSSWSTLVGCDTSILSNTTLLQCLRELSTGEAMGHLLGYGPLDEENLHLFHNLSGKTDNDRPFVITQKQQLWAHNMHKLYNKFQAQGKYKPLLYPVMSWGTTIDGKEKGLPLRPLDAFRLGNFNRVPVIMGTNADEGSIFVPLLYLVVPDLHIPLTDSDLLTAFGHFFNNNASITQRIITEYPVEDNKSAGHDAAVILRDYFFVCSEENALQAINGWGIDTWYYHFTYKGDFIENLFIGTYHSSEISFVFNNQWPPLIHIFSKNDKAMAATFNEYWSNFIHFYNPNGDGTINPPSLIWPSYNSTSLQNVVLDVPPTVEAGYGKDKCVFWNQISSEAPWN